MKKRNLILGLIGCGLLFTQVVKAETLDLTNISETGQNVVVGEVETPVYSVDITWGDMTFDYVYNEATQEFEWQEQITCTKISEQQKDYYQNLKIFTNSTCTSLLVNKDDYTFDDLVYSEYYYSSSSEGAGQISILDNSENGGIIPSLYWESSEKYNYVNGKFQYIGPMCGLVSESDFDYVKNNLYTDSSCTIKNTNDNPIYGEMSYYTFIGDGYIDMNYGVIPEGTSGIGNGNYYYEARIRLLNDYSKEITTPVKGDTIGRITVSIEAK